MRAHDFLITLITQDGYFFPVRPISILQFLTEVLLVLSDSFFFRSLAFKIYVAQVTRKELRLLHS